MRTVPPTTGLPPASFCFTVLKILPVCGCRIFWAVRMPHGSDSKRTRNEKPRWFILLPFAIKAAAGRVYCIWRKTGPFKLDSGLQDFETGIKQTGPSATRARHHLLVLLVLLHGEASLGRHGRGHPSHTILEWPGLAALHQELSYFLFLAHGHQQPWARKQASLSVRKLLARSGSTMPTVTG